MKTVAQNHASERLRSGTRVDSGQAVMLDTLGWDLRDHYAKSADALPDALMALARRLDGKPASRAHAL